MTPVPPDEPPPTWRNRAFAAYARLVELRDLPLLKRAGKAVVVTYQGDDARQGDVSRTTFDISIASHAEAGYYTASGDDHRRRRIGIVDRYADAIFALNPDLLRVLPARAEFLPYTSVDPAEWRPVPPAPGPPVVVHAPTHRGGKGTRFVLEAVERLRAEGLEFELELVEGLPRAEARRAYERAHVLVDQLLAGLVRRRRRRADGARQAGDRVHPRRRSRPCAEGDARRASDRRRAARDDRPTSCGDSLTTDRERLPELGARSPCVRRALARPADGRGAHAADVRAHPAALSDAHRDAEPQRRRRRDVLALFPPRARSRRARPRRHAASRSTRPRASAFTAGVTRA